MFKALLSYLWMLPFVCAAQVTISGRVLNQAGNKPVANASVFLSGGTIGAKSSAAGTVILNSVKPGKYELVVSIIGFDTYRQALTIENSDIKLADILIAPRAIALQEVNIKSEPDANRDKYLYLFEREFIGRSDLGKACKILNPELLDLIYNDTTNTLTASSLDFLVIENLALGYRLKYLLHKFSMNNINGSKTGYKAPDPQKIQFDGSVLFEDMKGTPSQLQRWQKKRQQVYEGSEMHFLRSALSETMEENGFRVLQLVSNYNSKKAKTTQTLMNFPLSAEEIVKPTDQQGIYALGCNGDALHITYNKNRRFSKNGQLANLDDPDNTETTIINFNTPYVFFDRNGEVNDPNSLSFTGAWGRVRTAELLPVDYEPPQNKNARVAAIIGPLTIAQPGPLKDSLLKVTAVADSAVKYPSAESIYMQFDKPYYAAGDTLWFKAYLFHAPTLGFSAKSGIMYVEITNDSNTFIKRYRLPVKEGISWGNISLNDFPAGSYVLRAYTNWMRNFDADGFFYKRFVIADSREQTWLASSRVTSSITEGHLQANLKLQLSDMDKTAIANKSLQLEVTAGKRHLYKQQVQTDSKGLLDVNFMVPEKAAGLAVVARDGEDKITIPVNLNRDEYADVQFLPEGGALVAGLPAHIGFKAIGEDGKGVNISGIVVDHNKKQAATFQSLHNGMGSFDLAVQPNETYVAKVNLPEGTVKEYPLPVIKNTGIVLDVKNPLDKDSVTVLAKATNDLMQSGESYFLIGKSRGIICYAAVLNFREGFISRNISKNLFPTGITHFMLTNTKGQPLSERLVFINHYDNLQIETSDNRLAYKPNDSISMQIKVTDTSGAPVAGNFSLAVTDDAQVKQDTINNENILTRLLLTGDLKGFVEEPGYYLETKTNESWQALDNLLLTQGWVSYDWLADKQHHEFTAEAEFEVKGQVQNGFNGALKGTHVTLLSKSPLFVKDTTTDKTGHFIFKDFPVIDTPAFVIKAVNRHDKSFNVGIVISDVRPPKPAIPAGPMISPWYISNDTALFNSARNNRIRMQQKYVDASGHMLKEVKITAKKIIKDSKNLNGAGNADLVLDETDMIQAGKKSWLDILQEKIKNFRDAWHGVYFIEDEYVIFIIDGIKYTPVGLVGSSGYAYDEAIFYFLQSHNAEDIKGIEVMSSAKYNSKYQQRFINPLDPTIYSFIEITTRSGHGPFLDNTPGMYLYKPLALSQPKQFYKPKYIVNDTTKHLPDLRSTIDWEPNLTTSKNGKATVSFYAADKPGTYTIIIEGTDGNGNLGFTKRKITISGKPEVKKQKSETK